MHRDDLDGDARARLRQLLANEEAQPVDLGGVVRCGLLTEIALAAHAGAEASTAMHSRSMNHFPWGIIASN